MINGNFPQSGAVFRDLQANGSACGDCPEMVVIPAGSFTMGSPKSEQDAAVAGGESRDWMEHESPQHRVTLAQPFAAGRYAVTFAEWDACVADGGCNGYRPEDLGWGRGRRPVINVSWNDSQSYLAWLNRKTGQRYRLLSEAEREYVTRAGTTTAFWWGDSITTGQANYDGNYTYNNGPKGEYRGRTVAVDAFRPNPFGLYQVHGNVSERVEDCWHGNYNGAPADGSAWTTGDCSLRVLRGGSWSDLPYFSRSALRSGVAPEGRDSSGGFRVARTLPPAP